MHRTITETDNGITFFLQNSQLLNFCSPKEEYFHIHG